MDPLWQEIEPAVDRAVSGGHAVVSGAPFDSGHREARNIRLRSGRQIALRQSVYSRDRPSSRNVKRWRPACAEYQSCFSLVHAPKRGVPSASLKERAAQKGGPIRTGYLNQSSFEVFRAGAARSAPQSGEHMICWAREAVYGTYAGLNPPAAWGALLGSAP